MATLKPKITPSLWFDRSAEEAARFYVSLFPRSRVTRVHKAPADYPGGGKAGDVLAVDFVLDGQAFNAINGGPVFRFSEAVSFVVDCKDQAEVDRYWTALSAVPEAEQCGWVKDRFGLSWQIVPRRLGELLGGKDAAQNRRVMEAMLQMKKLDVAGLERAAGAAAAGAPGAAKGAGAKDARPRRGAAQPARRSRRVVRAR